MSPFWGSDIALTGVDYSLNPVNPSDHLNNGVLEIMINTGKPPYKLVLYSTTMPVTEFQIEKKLSINNLAPGQYMTVVSDSEHAFKSKSITLINK
ncbi:MAG: hypothetical protein H7259_08265 [Cytophagales bacterium]|nr:hypothetical protein [Cytophaga sp.]